MTRSFGKGADILVIEKVPMVVCPNCGHREPHVVGLPCYDKRCPECGTQMVRE